MFLINKKTLRVLFLAAVLILLCVSALRFQSGPIVETNILSLLPENKNSALARYAEERVAQKLGHKIIVLVGHDFVEDAVKAAKGVRASLIQTDLFSQVTVSIDQGEIQSLLSFYKKYHYTLLTERQRRALTENDMDAIRSHFLSKIYGASFDMALVDMKNDPLILFQDYLSESMSQLAGRFTLVEGVPIVSVEGLYYAVIQVELADSSFSLNYQQKVLEALNQSQSAMEKDKEGLTFVRSGLIFHAIHGAEITKKEINKMGSLSLLAVLLLLTFTFKSLKPVLISMGVILFGVGMGVAACLLFFEKVHLLTLVFGTILIGISIDYMLHFFTERYKKEDWNAQRAVSCIFPGITLGVITSVIGFIGLCFTPFPGLQQMAIFCIAGLVSVYICVVLFYPQIFSTMRCDPDKSIYRLVSAYLKRWNTTTISHVRKIVVVLLVLLLGGIPFLEGKDDVRAMQSVSPELMANDLMTAELLGNPSASQFFVVSGTSEDEMLERLGEVSESLDLLKSANLLGSYHTLNDYVPSRLEQKSNLALLQKFVMQHKDELETLFIESGLPETAYTDYVRYLNSKTGLVFSLQDLLKMTGSEELSFLYAGEFEEQSVSLVTLEGVSDTHQLQRVAEGIDHIIFVDKVTSFSDLLNNYRHLSLLWVAAAYVVIFIILLMRYGFIQGAFILIPSLLATLISLSLVVFLVGSYSLFHVLALFLVMGIGVDYGLFLAENNKDERYAMIAIFLSALTTLLSFSLLMMSSTSALNDFGFTIAIGIVVTFLLSPIALTDKNRKVRLNDSL